MIVDPANLKAVLVRLLRAAGCECTEESIGVECLPRDMAPSAYLVTPPAACSPVLAAELARLTGRLLLPGQARWLFFQEEAQRIVSALGNWDGAM